MYILQQTITRKTRELPASDRAGARIKEYYIRNRRSKLLKTSTTTATTAVEEDEDDDDGSVRERG